MQAEAVMQSSQTTSSFAARLLPRGEWRPPVAVFGCGEAGAAAARALAASPLVAPTPVRSLAPPFSLPFSVDPVSERCAWPTEAKDEEAAAIVMAAPWSLSLIACSLADPVAVADALRLAEDLADAGHLAVLIGAGTSPETLPPVAEGRADHACHLFVPAPPHYAATALADVATAIAGPIIGVGIIGVDVDDLRSVLCGGGRGVSIPVRTEHPDPQALARALLCEAAAHGVAPASARRMLISTALAKDGTLAELDAGITAIRDGSGADLNACTLVFTGQIDADAVEGLVVLTLFD